MHEAQVFNVVITNIKSQTTIKWYRYLFGTSNWKLKDNVRRRCRSIWCTSSTIFKLRAILLWIINNFPAYSNLSGYSVKGHKACPVCVEEIFSI